MLFRGILVYIAINKRIHLDVHHRDILGYVVFGLGGSWDIASAVLKPTLRKFGPLGGYNF